MFFELSKHKATQFAAENWTYYEMYESEENGIPKPFITKSSTYLEKAKTYYHRHEYEICGNFLRKQAEYFCKNFLPKRKQFTPEFEPYDLNGLINQCVKYAKENGLNPDVFNDLNGHRKFVLNPSSHDSHSVAKFNHEIANCLSTFEDLEQLLFSHVIMAGTKFEFELSDSDGVSYKYQITLEEPSVLIKQPNYDSILTRTRFGYIVLKDGVATRVEPQYVSDSLGSFYTKLFNKSDKTKSESFWEEILDLNSNDKLQVQRVY